MFLTPHVSSHFQSYGKLTLVFTKSNYIVFFSCRLLMGAYVETYLYLVLLGT